MTEDCIFCKLANGKIPVKIIYENDNFVAFPDAHPLVPGHTLVVPKKHFKTLLDLPSSLGTELNDCLKQTAMLLMKEMKCGGFNVVNNNFEDAGQAVHHVHFHIVPRKKGDGLKFLVK
jgi:histidine triad (HIT) family protein